MLRLVEPVPLSYHVTTAPASPSVARRGAYLLVPLSSLTRIPFGVRWRLGLIVGSGCALGWSRWQRTACAAVGAVTLGGVRCCREGTAPCKPSGATDSIVDVDTLGW